MTTPLDIPESHRPLIELLRSAVNRAPLSTCLRRHADWATLLRQARQHGLDNYLYPWLAEQMPGDFSPRATVAPESAQAAWRTLYFQEVQRAFRRQRQLADILAALARADVDVVPLKGALLCETLYDDPARRSMSDIDLLVRGADSGRAHTALLGLGYQTKVDSRDNAFACDQAYRHDGHAAFIELHWNFHSEACPEDPRPDIEQIWHQTASASLHGSPVRVFSPCDQLAHLVDHLLHHHFALRLRAYIDLALLLRGPAGERPPDALQAASERWGIGTALPFTARLVEALFGGPSDREWWTRDSPAECRQRQQLAEILFRLPASETLVGETAFLRLEGSAGLARLRYALSRIFMPRSYLALRYPPARTRLGLPLAWGLRAWDLLALSRAHARNTAFHGQSAQGDLRDAAVRRAVVRQLMETKKPG